MLLNEKFIKPIGFNTWDTYLQELPKCETVWYFIFNYLKENKLGLQMEFITFHCSYQKNTFKMENSLCNIEEDSSHYFITCIFFRVLGKNKRSLKKNVE
jgi:hypothetical protein